MAISGCSSSAPPSADPGTPVGSLAPDARVPSVGSSSKNQERLKALWDQRAGKAETLDYPIGAGDVIEISVPGVDDLKDRVVRVSGEEQIELPLIGVTQVGGLTEAGLREKLKQALSKYMYNPQVDVFVKEYHSRQVAVVGAVRAPGLITLTGSGQTILDVVTEAGGMTADAADEIVILPNTQGRGAKLLEIASSFQAEPAPGANAAGASATRDAPNAPHQPSSTDAIHAAPPTGITMASMQQNISAGPAIVIPLKSNVFQGSLHYTNLPVEPGDIIVVPGGGNVMVTGWVYRPGFFQVGSGLTVLGAVGSAGGAMYAAAPDDATLMRSDSSGNKVSIPINLEKIASGEAADIPVRANDVIDIPYSDLKIGPYVVYNILTRMAVPIPAF